MVHGPQNPQPSPTGQRSINREPLDEGAGGEVHECPGEAEEDDIGDEVHDKPAVAGEKNEHGDDEGHGKQREEQGGEVDPDQLSVQLE